MSEARERAYLAPETDDDFLMERLLETDEVSDEAKKQRERARKRLYYILVNEIRGRQIRFTGSASQGLMKTERGLEEPENSKYYTDQPAKIVNLTTAFSYKNELIISAILEIETEDTGKRTDVFVDLKQVHWEILPKQQD